MNQLLGSIEQQGSHGVDIPRPVGGEGFKSPTRTQDLLKVKDDFVMPVTPPSTGFLQRDNIQSPQQPKSLLHEFTLVNFSIPNVNVEGVSLCVIYGWCPDTKSKQKKPIKRCSV